MSEATPESGAPEPPTGASVVYWATFDADDNPLALYRRVLDHDAKTLTLERLTADGAWADDPEVIAELREPEVRLVSAAQAQTIGGELGLRAETEAEMPEPPA